MHSVENNRKRLKQITGLERICWLNQSHSVRISKASETTSLPADAHWTDERYLGLAILSADCVPLALASTDGGVVAAAHCGWRGIAGGIVLALVNSLPSTCRDLHVWLGPAICKSCYEIGPEILPYLAERSNSENGTYASSRNGHVYVDLRSLIQSQLQQMGITRISQEFACTKHNSGFFSYRREKTTGRFVSLIWRN